MSIQRLLFSGHFTATPFIALRYTAHCDYYGFAPVAFASRPANPIEKIAVRRFVSMFESFPDLDFDVRIEPTNRERVAHRLVISVKGNLESRNAWQKSFDAWCALQGQVPKFRSGNALTCQTVAYAFFPGAHPIADFIVRWMGVEALSIDHSLGSRLSRLEKDVASLHRQRAHPLHSATQGDISAL